MFTNGNIGMNKENEADNMHRGIDVSCVNNTHIDHWGLLCELHKNVRFAVIRLIAKFRAIRRHWANYQFLSCSSEPKHTSRHRQFLLFLPVQFIMSFCSSSPEIKRMNTSIKYKSRLYYFMYLFLMIISTLEKTQ